MGKKRKGSAGRKPIRVGVVGVWRGMTFAETAGKVGMQLVALCDTNAHKLACATRRCGVAGYADFEAFLEHDMDAVILANYFHEHAPLAVKALTARKHVMSETSACKTLGEAVALVRAVERSGCIYMLAENYCFFATNQEMRRLYRAGEIGEVQFAEGEYIHPFPFRQIAYLSPGRNHWRNWCPSTYYCTHALGPIMYITDTRPTCVNAQSIPHSEKDAERAHFRRTDPGATIVLRMDNGSITNIQGLTLRGHGNWYRLHGTRGLMENLRPFGERDKLRVVHEPWDMRPGDVREKIYVPEFGVHADLAARAGHAGGDFFTCHFFTEAIRTGKQPWLDVYRAVDMTLVGIQAWKSCLANGAPVEIPDFRKESARRKYAGENWSPYPEDRAPGQPPASIRKYPSPSAKELARANKIWAEQRAAEF